MKIIGIDASLTGTGLAISSGGETRTMTIQSRLTGPARLIEIRDKVRAAIMGADLVAIESYAYAMANQAHQIGELGGVIRVMMAEEGIQWIEVAPAQLKKFATGKGNAKKEEIAVAIFKRWGRDFRTNDEADAFVLARIGEACFTGQMGALTLFQKAVIEELRGPKVRRRRAVG